MVVRNRIDDYVKSTFDGFHLVAVAGQNDMIGAQAQSILLFAPRAGKQGHIGTERLGTLQRHVAQDT
ncbi:hypothetical protein D3C75_1374380 [compost metagenome]